MPDLTFPALFRCADDASDRAQKRYLNLIRAEYAILLLAAVFALNLSTSALYYAAYALLFCVSIILLLYRRLNRPEEAWYKCRALAESIKTSTWRYAMRAEPFNMGDSKAAKAEFRGFLKSILDSNRHIGDKITGLPADGDQVTTEMDQIRQGSLEERRGFYLQHRVRDQRSWYTRKAAFNQRSATIWTIICVATYVLALMLVLFRIAVPEWKIWPVGPILVFASSALGWMQIKKFTELSSSYTLTAHEIGIIQSQIDEADSEESLSQFVNEAELAFSREHTQWVARQTKG